MPGHSASSRQAENVSVVPPNAGIKPTDGKIVPIRPAATGAKKSVNVSAGIQRSIAAVCSLLAV